MGQMTTCNVKGVTQSVVNTQITITCPCCSSQLSWSVLASLANCFDFMAPQTLLSPAQRHKADRRGQRLAGEHRGAFGS